MECLRRGRGSRHSPNGGNGYRSQTSSAWSRMCLSLMRSLLMWRGNVDNDIVGFLGILGLLVCVFILVWIIFYGIMPMGWCGEELIFRPFDVGKCITQGNDWHG